MIDDWRYTPERLEERRFCLGALIYHKIPIDRKVYQFCHDFTSSGACKGLMERYKEKGQMAIWREVLDAYETYCHETDMGPEPKLVPLEGVDKVG